MPGFLQKSTIFPIIILLSFCAISAVSMDYLTFEKINQHKQQIGEFIQLNYQLSVALFYLACCIFINSPIPLAALFKLLGGFFFGFYLGAFFNITATFLACILGFLLSRYTFKNSFEKKYYHRLKKVEDDIEHNGFYYLLSLRFIMIVPYFLTNILAGISRISFSKYVYSTAIGVIPASLMYANAGSKLEQISSPSELISIEIILAFTLIALLSLLPALHKKLF